MLDLEQGAIQPDEVPFRLQAEDGYARSGNSKFTYVFRREDGRLVGTSRLRDDLLIRETRVITSDNEREVIDRIAVAEQRFAADSAKAESARSLLMEILSSDEPNSIDRDFEARNLSSTQADALQDVIDLRKELEPQSQEIEDIESFLSDILSSKIPADELQYRLNAKDGYARVGEGDEALYVARNSDNKLIGARKPTLNSIREAREVSTDQQIALQYFSSRTNARSELAREAFALQSTASEIASGTAEILPTDESDEARSIAILKQRVTGLPPEQREQVIALGRQIIDDQQDEEALVYVQTLVASNEQSAARTAQNFFQALRQARIQATFYSQPTMRDSEAVLDDYQLVDATDRALVSRLRRVQIEQNRDIFLLAALRSVAGGSLPNFDEAVRLLSESVRYNDRLNDPEGLNAVSAITSAIFEADQKAQINGLVALLSDDRQLNAQAEERIAQIAVRPSIGSADYLDAFGSIKETFVRIRELCDQIGLDVEIAGLQQSFASNEPVLKLIDQIINLPGTTDVDVELQQRLLDELAFTVSAYSTVNPERARQLKDIADGGIKRINPENEVIDLTETPANRNIAALTEVARRFRNVVMPLFEAVRGNGNGQLVTEYTGPSRRGNYVQKIAELTKQRELTAIEASYLESVELLSVFNPHLVALCREKPELLSLYLESHFTQADTRTKEALSDQDDIYVPMIAIGYGPNGVAAAGELNRCNPELAKNTLFIGADMLPGGPFGVAKGDSWELNSASSLGETTNNLPDLTELDRNGMTVRSYGSPLIAYPGERTQGSNGIRTASINANVDWLVNPDQISDRRYPRNTDEARVVQIQSSLLMDNVLFDTTIERVEPVDDGLPGNKRVTLSYIEPATGQFVRKTVRTDIIGLGGGLGNESYGFELEGSDAEKIINSETPEGAFPPISLGLEAFQIMSNPVNERPISPSGTVVVYGGGNTTDVLIEYLGRQFESGNPNLNRISKVIVISDKPASERPRYAQINDLRRRNGQPNFIEVVSGRVGDIRFDDDKLVIPDPSGNLIESPNEDGVLSPIRADHVVSGAGYRPNFDAVFAAFLNPGESIDRRTGLATIKLPNNPNFTIANELRSDPDIFTYGTISQDDFKNPNKLETLPRLPVEALLRNGVENAVAIGFRTPDTRAAVRIKLQNRTDLAPSQLHTADQADRKLVSVESNVEYAPSGITIRTPQTELPLTRKDVSADTETLTALFLQTMQEVQIAEDIDSKRTTTTRNYTLKVNMQTADSGEVVTLLTSSDMPLALLNEAKRSIENPYFLSYATKAMRERRRPNGLNIELTFKNGRLMMRSNDRAGQTFVEAA